MNRIVSALFFVCLCVFWAPISGYCAEKDATDYPKKPIKLIVPFGQEGSADLTGRIMAKHLSEKLGVKVNVANVSGSAGAVGAQQAAEADPDGYTVLVHLPTLLTAHHTGVSRITWDDLIPVARGQQFFDVLAVGKNSPWQTVGEMLDYAKANPGKVKWGINPGAGLHFIALDFANATNTLGDWQYVNTGSDETSLQALLGGHIDVMVGSDSVLAKYVRDGKIRPLGAFADQRVPALPDLSTFREQGIPTEFVFDNVYYLPKGTDQAIVDKLREAIREISENPEYRQELAANGILPAYLAGQELLDRLMDEDVQYYKFARQAGLIPVRK